MRQYWVWQLQNLGIVHYSTFLFYFFVNEIKAQNLEKILSKEIIKVDGSIQIFTNFKAEKSLTSFTTAYNNGLNGNLTVKLADIHFPFSFQYSANAVTVQKPANLISVHPSYKWLKLHAGKFSSSLSPNTYNGRPIKGFGLEINPNKIHLAAYFGKLEDLKTNVFQESERLSYERNCAAFSIKTAFKTVNFSLFYFYAGDRIHFKDSYLLYKKLIPERNEAISGQIKLKLFSKLNIEGEYATSSYLNNLSFAEKKDNSPFLFITKRNHEEVRIFSLIKAGLFFSSSQNNTSFTLERVSPGYSTLGIFNLPNDRVAICIKSTHAIIKKRLSVSFSAGTQSNNLNKTKKETSICSNVNSGFVFNLSKYASLSCNYTYSLTGSLVNEKQVWDKLAYRFYLVNQSQHVLTLATVFKIYKREFNINYSGATSLVVFSGIETRVSTMNIQSACNILTGKKLKGSALLIYSESRNKINFNSGLGAAVSIQYLLGNTFQMNITINSKYSVNTKQVFQKAGARMDIQKKIALAKVRKERLKLNLSLSNEYGFYIERKNFFSAQAQIQYSI